MHWDCVYVWFGGRKHGHYEMRKPEHNTAKDLMALVAEMEMQGRVAFLGREALGPPSEPPMQKTFDSIWGVG